MDERFLRDRLAKVQIAPSIPENPRNNVPRKLKGLVKTGLVDTSDRNSGCPVSRFAQHLNLPENLANLRLQKLLAFARARELLIENKFLTVNTVEFTVLLRSILMN